LIVLYGEFRKSSHRYSSKIASIAKPNQVLVGEHIYNILVLSLSTNHKESLNTTEFIEVIDPMKWKYLSF
jgi:hypothetical protein